MMDERILHFVAISSRDRAALSRLGFELGMHCEVYNDADELKARLPEHGIVIAEDVPERGGIERIVDLIEDWGRWLPVVAMAHDPRPGRVVAALKYGVLDYMSLPLEKQRLSGRIAQIALEVEAQGMARKRMATARERIGNLTAREREVLDWLVEGCSNKMIARELDISPRTVEIHRSNMMGKLGASHSSEAVRMRLEAIGGLFRASPGPQPAPTRSLKRAEA